MCVLALHDGRAPADDQLPRTRSGVRPRLRPERGAARPRSTSRSRTRWASAATTAASCSAASPELCFYGRSGHNESEAGGERTCGDRGWRLAWPVRRACCCSRRWRGHRTARPTPTGLPTRRSGSRSDRCPRFERRCRQRLLPDLDPEPRRARLHRSRLALQWTPTVRPAPAARAGRSAPVRARRVSPTATSSAVVSAAAGTSPGARPPSAVRSQARP